MCDYCAWIQKILRPPRLEALPTICSNTTEEPKRTVKYDRVILVHGTADSISSREEINGILERIEKAATEAYKELAKGCESVDAVELAIRHLENEESSTNLSKINNNSAIRDAAVMDSDSNAGSVGAVTGIPHPITLAKRVMQKTDHVLIVESGVHELLSLRSKTETSDEMATGSEHYFPQEKQLDARRTETSKKSPRLYGAIARDRRGRLACGVSTLDDREDSVVRSSMSAGGTVLGCGIFADGESCCSVSGEDRAIYVYAPARKIIGRLKCEGATARGSNDEAVRVDEVLSDELTNFFKDTGESCIGAAALRVQGKPEVAFKSRYFPWACCSKGVITSGCIKDEIFTKDVEGLDMPLDCECR